MLTGWRSASCHDNDQQCDLGCVDERSDFWPKALRHCGRVRVVEDFSLNARVQSRPDLLLLLSLLVAFLLTPVLEHGNLGRLVLSAVTFIPVLFAIVRLPQIKGWVWPSILLALGNLIFVVAGK
jgi:hypothetical protein